MSNNNTYLTVRGRVASDLRTRRFDDGAMVVSFRLVATPTWWDRTTKSWAKGRSSWMTVSCWRFLAENVQNSVKKGDGVIVYGRVHTREWSNDQGGKGSSLDLEADTVGHDLAWGTSEFTRVRRSDVVEAPGRAEVDEIARSLELETPADLSILLDPDDDFADEEFDEDDDDGDGDGDGEAQGAARGVLTSAGR